MSDRKTNFIRPIPELKDVYNEFVNSPELIDTARTIMRMDIIGLFDMHGGNIILDKRQMIRHRNQFAEIINRDEKWFHTRLEDDSITHEAMEMQLKEFRKIKSIIEIDHKAWFDKLKTIISKFTSDKDLIKLIDYDKGKMYQVLHNYPILAKKICVLEELTVDHSDYYEWSCSMNGVFESAISRDFFEFIRYIVKIQFELNACIYRFNSKLSFLNSEISGIDKKISLDNYAIATSIPAGKSIEDIKKSYKSYVEFTKTNVIKIRSKLKSMLSDSFFDNIRIEMPS